MRTGPWRSWNSRTLLVGNSLAGNLILTIHPSIPLLGIYLLSEMKTYVPTSKWMLFKIAKTQKQPKCASNEEWINKLWPILTIEYLFNNRKGQILITCSNNGWVQSIHCAKWDSKGYDSISMTFWKEQNYRNRINNGLMITWGLTTKE